MLELLNLIGLLFVFVLVISCAFYFIYVKKSSIKQKKNFNNSKYKYRKIDSYKHRLQRRKTGYLRNLDLDAILN